MSRIAGIAVVAVAAAVAALSGEGAPGSVSALAPFDAVVTHLAGPDAGPGYADGAAGAARFAYPWGVAVDASGVTWVADSANHTIRRVAADGTVTTVAGLSGTPGSTDGPGADARFRFPTAVVVGPAGVLYVCDSGNHTIRSIAADGTVSTLAGAAGQAGYQDGSGTAARFSSPERAAVDTAGNLLVADTGNHVIRRVTPAGAVTTLAGLAGQAGSTDGATTVAKFSSPGGLVVAMGSAGVVFRVADTGNNAIRYVDDRHTVSTIAGAAGSPGSTDGTWAASRYSAPSDIAPAFDLGYVVADTGNSTVRWLEGPGTTATLAGTAGQPGFADGTGAAARFSAPRGIAQGAAAYLVADTGNHAIRRIAEGGVTTTLSGSAAVSGASDAVGAAARFASPSGVAFTAAGAVLVADTANHTVRAIDPSGSVSTLAGAAGESGSGDGSGGAARFAAPYGVAVDTLGVAWVTDQSAGTVRRVAADGGVTTFAGTAGQSGSTDATGVDARFAAPSGIAVGAGGTLYVADRDNHTIRAITAAGVTSTLAGTAGSAGLADGSGAAARFDHPTGVAVNPLTGEILIADRGNRRVRVVTPTGAVSTLTGTVGGASAALEFADPVAVTVDAVGNAFVLDGDGHDIVLVRPSGEVRAFAGAPGTPGNVDGVASAARFYSPRGIAAGALGTLAVADAGSNAVRKVVYEVPSEVCVPATIASQSADQVVAAGQSGTATVTVGGTPPFTYQWYAGAAGDTSSPIAGATTATLVTAPLAQTATAWARVANQCGTADSATVTFTVCAWSVAPATASFTHAGGVGSLEVTTQSPCGWTAVSSADWLTVTSAASGSGPATVTYAVAPNQGSERTATITVGGQAHTVTQGLLPRYFISSVAHAPGASSTKWRTDLAAVNRNADPVELTLTFFPYDGGAGVPVTRTLAAGATVEWKDALVSLFAQTASNIKGAVQVDASLPVLLSSRTYNQAASGTYGQEYPAVRTATALGPGVVGVLPQLAKSTQFRTNVGILNTGGADATVEIRLFAAAGTQAGNTRTATVAPGRYWQQDDVFGAAGAGSQGSAYATIAVQTEGGAVWAYASVIDNATGDPTTVPVQTASSGPFLVSSQAHLPGFGGTVWRSALSVVNRGDAEAALTLTYYPYGSGEPVQRTQALAAGAAVEWSDVLVSLFGLGESANVKGSVAVAATQPVVAFSRTFNQATTGTFGQGYPAIGAGQALTAGRVGVIPQLKKSAATRTNVGVLNLGAADVAVAVTLHGASGARVGTTQTATIGASRYWQQDDIFAAAGAGSQEIAYATLEVQTPGGAVWAYGSVIDATTGDPTTVALQIQ